MAKFYGIIGFVKTVDKGKGIWGEELAEKPYAGDVIRNGLRAQSSDKLIDDLIITNQISIIADSFANENLGTMKYVIYRGAKWKILEITESHPRLILTLGGVYNG